jgi:hypothetical protein
LSLCINRLCDPPSSCFAVSLWRIQLFPPSVYHDFLPFKAPKQASTNAGGGSGSAMVTGKSTTTTWCYIKVGLKRGPWTPEEDKPDCYSAISYELGKPSASSGTRLVKKSSSSLNKNLLLSSRARAYEHSSRVELGQPLLVRARLIYMPSWGRCSKCSNDALELLF